MSKLNIKLKCSNLKKALPCVEPRRMTYWAFTSVQRSRR